MKCCLAVSHGLSREDFTGPDCDKMPVEGGWVFVNGLAFGRSKLANLDCEIDKGLCFSNLSSFDLPPGWPGLVFNVTLDSEAYHAA